MLECVHSMSSLTAAPANPAASPPFRTAVSAVPLCQVDSRVVWRQRLAEVEDDMETKLLRAQQAELPFTLQVPDKASQRTPVLLCYWPITGRLP